MSINHFCMTMDNFNPEEVIKALESYGIKPRGNAQGAPGPLVHYISVRMENRGGAKEGTPELYFTDPDGLIVQLQSFKGGAGDSLIKLADEGGVELRGDGCEDDENYGHDCRGPRRADAGSGRPGS